MTQQETEKEQTIRLANTILDRPYADPDDDLAMLSRQFLRSIERESETEKRVIERVREEVQDFLNITGCVGIFQSSSPTEAKGWCCPRHYGQNNILSLPSLQTNKVELVEEYHNGKFRRTINGVEMPFKFE